MGEIIAQRVFSPLYIYLDAAFIVVLCALLAYKRQYVTLAWGLFGGVLYFIVDFGIFYLICHARSISGGSLFWVLLWMSMSYGITNFVLIWLWLGRDRRAVEWSLLIFAWWIACPQIADTFGGGLPAITIQRTTSGYHGYMALILFASYFGLIVHNLLQKDVRRRFPLPRLVLIGVAVQFAWEFALLVGGIRSAALATFEDKIMVLAVNSLLETNLGMPLIYLIYLTVTKTFAEDFRRRPAMTLYARLEENAARRFLTPRGSSPDRAEGPTESAPDCAWAEAAASAAEECVPRD